MTTPANTASREIEFWFDFGSNYSYLALMRVEAMAAAKDVRIVWKPFLLGPIFKAQGFSTSPFVLQQQKGAYVWRDMERQCEKYGLPWTRPSTFPRRALLPLRVALNGAGEPWAAAFCKRIMLLNFSDDRDVDDAIVVAETLMSLGLPAVELIDAAQSDHAKRALREQTEEAARRGIFGGPTFFVDGEMYWGNDRLEDALAFAARA